MDDLKNYILKRIENDTVHEDDYTSGYDCFKAGLILRMLRLQGSMTQKELAGKLNMRPDAISQMENHTEDMRLSDLIEAARLFGRTVRISII